MEEILASIRRILNEDETTAAASAPAAPDLPATEDVLVLDESMLVSPPKAAEELPPKAAVEPPPRDAVEPPPKAAVEPLGQESPPAMPPAPVKEPVREAIDPDLPKATPVQDMPAGDLVAPEAAAAAASSLGSLVRTLSAGRATPVYSGGPTLEDMVRAELRPMLKDWLDAHLSQMIEATVRAELRPPLKSWLDINLPPLVERLVRAELERVVGRAVP